MSSRPDPRHEWRRRALCDRRLSPTAFRLACALAEHFNRETLEAWPAQATLAGMIGIDLRTTRRLVGELSRAGYIEVGQGRGRHKSCTYRMLLDEEKIGQSCPVLSDGKPDTDDRFSAENRTILSGKADTADQKIGQFCPENRTLVSAKPYKEPSQRTNSASCKDADADLAFRVVEFFRTEVQKHYGPDTRPFKPEAVLLQEARYWLGKTMTPTELSTHFVQRVEKMRRDGKSSPMCISAFRYSLENDLKEMSRAIRDEVLGSDSSGPRNRKPSRAGYGGSGYYDERGEWKDGRI